jgi:hypothetical protein
MPFYFSISFISVFGSLILYFKAKLTCKFLFFSINPLIHFLTSLFISKSLNFQFLLILAKINQFKLLLQLNTPLWPQNSQSLFLHMILNCHSNFNPIFFFYLLDFFCIFFYDFQDLFSNMQKSNNKMIKIYWKRHFFLDFLFFSSKYTKIEVKN